MSGKCEWKVPQAGNYRRKYLGHGLKVVINGIRLGLLTSLVCKVSVRGMSAACLICLVTKLRL